ncbi:hypothetical protein [Streptomyces cyaneofuscatus]|uniref:hypothetical protein n=2 Tax=Streptomyces cyaneofuscatus TaxID=66883 RepID=UPI0036E27F7A
MHSSIADYWRRDDEHDGETLQPTVVGQLRYLVDLLKEQRPDPLRDGLHSIAAELARLTGSDKRSASKLTGRSVESGSGSADVRSSPWPPWQG